MMQPIPERTRKGIERYVEFGGCGDFIEAVLSNDLAAVVFRADSENLAALEAIVSYVYNHIPADCWGSREKVAAWKAKRLAEREWDQASEMSPLGRHLFETGVALMRTREVETDG